MSYKLSGAIIVTTPQDIALLDARKAIEMFKKVNIPVLGIIENMALHTCTNCGHHEHIFGKDGAKLVASEYGSEVLGVLPLSIEIREHIDEGKPCVHSNPKSAISEIYQQASLKIVNILECLPSPLLSFQF